MAVRMIKKSWWVDFRAGHTRYRKRSPENTRTGAQTYEAMLRHRLALGESLAPTKSEPRAAPIFEEFAPRWVEQYVKSNNKSSEQYAKHFILKSSLVPFFGPFRLGEIKL